MQKKSVFSIIETTAPTMGMFNQDQYREVEEILSRQLSGLEGFKIKPMSYGELSGFENEIDSGYDTSGKNFISISMGENRPGSRLGIVPYLNETGDVSHWGIYELKLEENKDDYGNIVGASWKRKQSMNNNGLIANIISPGNNSPIDISPNGVMRYNPNVIGADGISNGVDANLFRLLNRGLNELNDNGYVNFGTKKLFRDLTYTMSSMDNRRSVAITNYFQMHTGLNMNPEDYNFRDDMNMKFAFNINDANFSNQKADVYSAIYNNIFNHKRNFNNFTNEAMENFISADFGNSDFYARFMNLYDSNPYGKKMIEESGLNMTQKKGRIARFFETDEMQELMNRNFNEVQIEYGEYGSSKIRLGTDGSYFANSFDIYNISPHQMIRNSDLNIYSMLTPDISSQFISGYNSQFNNVNFNAETYVNQFGFDKDTAKILIDELAIRSYNGHALHTADLLVKEKQAISGKANALNLATFQPLGYLNQTSQRTNQSFDIYESAELVFKDEIDNGIANSMINRWTKGTSSSNIFTRGFVENVGANKIFDDIDADLGFSGRKSKEAFYNTHAMVFYSNDNKNVFEDSVIIDRELKNNVRGGFASEIDINNKNIDFNEIDNILGTKYQDYSRAKLYSGEYNADMKRLLLGEELDADTTFLKRSSNSGSNFIPFENSRIINNVDETIGIKGATSSIIEDVKFDANGNITATFNNFVDMVGGAKVIFGDAKGTVSQSVNGLYVGGERVGALMNYKGLGSRGFGATFAGDILNTMAYHSGNAGVFEEMKQSVFGNSKLLDALNIDIRFENGKIVFDDRNITSVNSFKKQDWNMSDLPVEQIYRNFYNNRKSILGDMSESEYNNWFDQEVKTVLNNYEVWQKENLGNSGWIIGDNLNVSGGTYDKNSVDYGTMTGMRLFKPVSLMNETKSRRIGEAVTMGRLGEIVLNEKGMGRFANTMEDFMIEKNSNKMAKIAVASGMMNIEELSNNVSFTGNVIRDISKFGDDYTFDKFFQGESFSNMTVDDLKNSLFSSFMPGSSRRKVDFYSMKGYDDGTTKMLNSLFENDILASGSYKPVQEIRDTVLKRPVMGYDIESFYYKSTNASDNGAQVTNMKQISYQAYNFEADANGEYKAVPLIDAGVDSKGNRNLGRDIFIGSDQKTANGYLMNRAFMPVLDENGNYQVVNIDIPQNSNNGNLYRTGDATVNGQNAGKYTINQATRWESDAYEAISQKRTDRLYTSKEAVLKFYDDILGIESQTGVKPILMGHNIESYDNNVLLNEARYILNTASNLTSDEKTKLTNFITSMENGDYGSIDTLRTVRILGINPGANTLGTTYKNVHGKVLDAHNSMNDIDGTTKVLNHLLKVEGDSAIPNIDEFDPLINLLKSKAQAHGLNENYIESGLGIKLAVAKRVLNTTSAGPMGPEQKTQAKVAWQFMNDIKSIMDEINSSGEYANAVKSYSGNLKTPLTGDIYKDMASIVQSTNIVANIKDNEDYNLFRRFASTGEINAFIDEMYVNGSTNQIGYNGSFVGLIKAHHAVQVNNSAVSALENVGNISISKVSDGNKNIIGSTLNYREGFLNQDGGLDINSLTRNERMEIKKYADSKGLTIDEALRRRNELVEKAGSSSQVLTKTEVEEMKEMENILFSKNSNMIKDRVAGIFSDLEESSRMLSSAIHSQSQYGKDNMFGKKGIIQRNTELKLDNSYTFSPMYETNFFSYVEADLRNGSLDRAMFEQEIKTVYGEDVGESIIKQYRALSNNPNSEEITKFIEMLRGKTGVQIISKDTAVNLGMLSADDKAMFNAVDSFMGGNPMQFQSSIQGTRTVIFDASYIDGGSTFLKRYLSDLNSTMDPSLTSVAVLGRKGMKGAGRDFDGDTLFSAYFNSKSLESLKGNASTRTAKDLNVEGMLYSRLNYVASNTESWDDFQKTSIYKEFVNEIPGIIKGKKSNKNLNPLGQKMNQYLNGSIEDEVRAIYNLERFNQSWSEGAVNAEAIKHMQTLDALFGKGSSVGEQIIGADNFVKDYDFEGFLKNADLDVVRRELENFSKTGGSANKFASERAMKSLDMWRITGKQEHMDDVVSIMRGKHNQSFAFDFFGKIWGDDFKASYGKRTGISQTGLAHNFFTIRRQFSSSFMNAEYASKWYDYLKISGKNISEDEFLKVHRFSTAYAGFEKMSENLIQSIISSKKGMSVDLNEAFDSIKSIGNLKGVDLQKIMDYIDTLEFGKSSDVRTNIGDVLNEIGLIDKNLDSWDKYIGSLSLNEKESKTQYEGLKTVMSLLGYKADDIQSGEQLYEMILKGEIQYDGKGLLGLDHMRGKDNDIFASIVSVIGRMNTFNQYGGEDFSKNVSRLFGNNPDIASIAEAVDIAQGNLLKDISTATQFRAFDRMLNFISRGSLAETRGASLLNKRNTEFFYTYFDKDTFDGLNDTVNSDKIEHFYEQGKKLIEEGKIQKKYLSKREIEFFKLLEERNGIVSDSTQAFEEATSRIDNISKSAENISNKASEVIETVSSKTPNWFKNLSAGKKTGIALTALTLAGYNMYRRKDSVQVEMMYQEDNELDIYRDIAENYEMRINKKRF